MIRSDAFAAACGTALLIAGALIVPAGAQEPVEQHPTAIHQGTCEQPGELVAELVSLLAPSGDAIGASGANAVKQGDATVDLPMADIVSRDHIVVVLGGPTYAADRRDEIIACGAIGGVPMDDIVTFGLAPMNDSSHVGVAMLSEREGSSALSIYVVEYAASEAFDEAQG